MIIGYALNAAEYFVNKKLQIDVSDIKSGTSCYFVRHYAITLLNQSRLTVK